MPIGVMHIDLKNQKLVNNANIELSSQKAQLACKPVANLGAMDPPHLIRAGSHNKMSIKTPMQAQISALFQANPNF